MTPACSIEPSDRAKVVRIDGPKKVIVPLPTKLGQGQNKNFSSLVVVLSAPAVFFGGGPFLFLNF